MSRLLPIVDWRIATETEWDDAWSGSLYATFFHSRTWHELFMSYTGGGASAIKVQFADGIDAIVPISSRLPGLISRLGIRMGRRAIYESSPAGTMGGWIPHSGLNADHVETLAAWLLKKERLVWRINPYDPHASVVLRMVDKVIEPDTTQMLEFMSAGTMTMRGWSKGHRAAVSQARRLGVNIRIASSAQDWLAYYRCYLDALGRWGGAARTRYRYKLFKLLSACSHADLKLWVAELQGEVVAGVICLYSLKHVSYWHGAALSRAFFARPTHALLYESIMHASAHGYRWYDFNPSAGLDGVRQFKKGFGAREISAGIVKT